MNVLMAWIMETYDIESVFGKYTMTHKIVASGVQ